MASFQLDSQVGKMAEAYSLDAVDLAARNFEVVLDSSEESIKQVEQMLDELHRELIRAHPPEDAIWTFAKMFGSYVGEVLLRHHGGEWGTVRMGDTSFPGLQQKGGG